MVHVGSPAGTNLVARVRLRQRHNVQHVLYSAHWQHPSTAENGTTVETHLAVTTDANNQIATAYINGTLARIIYNYDYNPSTLATAPNSAGPPTQNYLGKSQYADPYFSGSINEFRIYDTTLTAAQIAASFAAGPDGTPP